MSGAASKRKGEDSEERAKRGKANKRRGYYFEKKTEEFLTNCGLQADRDGRSGRRDVFFWLHGSQNPRKAESKARAGGRSFKTITNWLGSNDVLIVWEVGKPGMIIMRPDTFKELVQRGEGQ